MYCFSIFPVRQVKKSSAQAVVKMNTHMEKPEVMHKSSVISPGMHPRVEEQVRQV